MKDKITLLDGEKKEKEKQKRRDRRQKTYKNKRKDYKWLSSSVPYKRQ
jgi:hypothetical protein